MSRPDPMVVLSPRFPSHTKATSLDLHMLCQAWPLWNKIVKLVSCHSLQQPGWAIFGIHKGIIPPVKDWLEGNMMQEIIPVFGLIGSDHTTA